MAASIRMRVKDSAMASSSPRQRPSSSVPIGSSRRASQVMSTSWSTVMDSTRSVCSWLAGASSIQSL